MTRPEVLKQNAPLLWSTGTGPDVWDLFCACVDGDLATVHRLIAKAPSLARSNYAYRTPLYFAIRENRLDIVEFLLDHGAGPVNPDLLDIARDRGYADLQQLLEAKMAALHNVSRRGEAVAQAIRDRDLAAVRAQLDAAPDLLRAGDARGNQPIHWAVMTRQIDVIDELLQRGADVNARRADGARPIQLTSGDYHFRGWRDVPKDPTTPAQVLSHLRARGADLDICTASYIGDIDRVKHLLAEDPSLANRVSDYVTYYPCSGSPLRNAAEAGHLEILKLLLEHGADPNLREEGIAPRGHALYAAAAHGHYEIAKQLLERGAYPNPEVESSADALSRAISNNDDRMADLLCSYGASRSIDILGYHGDVRTAAAVFAANPALADDPEALADAAGQGHEPFVRLLLRYHPDLPKRISFPGWSVGAKTRELNELLFQHGMDPSRPDWLGITPLHQLARKGEVEKAALFVAHGADLNARDEDLCSTPLGWAARYGKIEMVEFLLKHGAKPNLPDDLPRFSWATPLAWASSRGHGEIAELLKRFGATPAA